jgi:hypothetical protein
MAPVKGINQYDTQKKGKEEGGSLLIFEGAVLLVSIYYSRETKKRRPSTTGRPEGAESRATKTNIETKGNYCDRRARGSSPLAFSTFPIAPAL